MSHEVTVTITDDVYTQASLLAQQSQRSLEMVLSESLTRTFQPFAVHPQRELMQREVAAYERQHESLIEDYLGAYVAMHQGQVVDHDVDEIKLAKRIRKQFGGSIVLIRKVERELPPVLRLRSPRFVVEE